VEKVIERFARAPAGHDALKILSSMGGEAMEEVVSGALAPALESIYSGGDVRDGYSRETASDMAYSALIGGILGGLGGSAEVSGIRGADTARETGGSFSAFDRLLRDTPLSPLNRTHLASDLADVRSQYAEALRALSDPFSTQGQRALAAQSAIDHADWASRRLGELYPGQDAQAQRELETVAEELEPFTLDEDGEKVLDPFKTVEVPGWTGIIQPDIIDTSESLSEVRKPTVSELNARAIQYKNVENNGGIIAARSAAGEYDLTQKHQKYLQHVQGTVQYQNATNGRGTPQSYLTINEQEAQGIIYRYCGTGEVRITKVGEVLGKEYVTTDRVVGKYYEKGAWHETKRVMIIYSMYGTHIVPVKER